jgi:NH3-dependent NAD+ synthetase
MSNIKITLAQLNYTVGDVEGNTKKIIKAIKNNSSSDLIVFSELCIIGYPPLDLVYNDDLINQQSNAIIKIEKVAILHKTDIVLGVLLKNYNKNQKPYFNSLIFIRHDNPEYIVQNKTLLPTYNIFNEDRYFEAGKKIETIKYKGANVVFAVCEDLWGDEEKLYNNNPLADALCANNVDLIISINASPSNIGKIEDRIIVCKNICKEYQVNLIYCNQVGSNDDIVFDGTSFFMTHEGKIIKNAKSFKEQYITNVYHSQTNEFQNWHKPKKYVPNKNKFIYKQLLLGIKDYAKKCGFKKVVIGSSGGIDSAVVIALAAKALGSKNVTAITMPNTEVSSLGSVKLSDELCRNLNIELLQIPITPVFGDYIKIYQCIDENLEKYGLTGQNLQARIRGAFLMMYSNQNGSLLLTTGNKSEISVGYCIKGDNYILTDNGIYTAKELNNYLSNLTNTFIKHNLVSQTFVSDKNETYYIETEIGNMIGVSSDHKIKVFENDKLIFKRADELKVDDIVSISYNEQIFSKNDANIDFKFVRKKWDFKSKSVDIPTKINKQWSKFLGICVADGSYYNNGYCITTTKQEVIDFMINFSKSIKLNLSITEEKQKFKSTYRLRLSSVIINEFLQHVGVMNSSHTKVIPNIILKSTKEIIISFLSGLFLDSSCHYSSKELKELMYNSVSKELAKQVHIILLNLGIVSYFRIKNKNNKSNIYCQVYIPTIEMPKLLNFELLKVKITDKIVQNIINRKKTKSAFDLIYGYKNELYDLSNIINGSNSRNLRYNLNHNKKISRYMLTKYLDCVYECINDNTDEKIINSIQKLNNVVNSNRLFIKVKSIDVKQEQSKMYDFTVETSHEFTVNNIETHNCTIYGDACGGLAPIADLYKTEVYELAEYINRNEIIIPNRIIKQAPSAELAPDQKDTDSLPPYFVLDQMLKLYIEGDLLSDNEREKLQDYCLDINTTNYEKYIEICKKVDNNEFKRRQLSPTIRIHKRAFGSGRQLPIAQKFRNE